MRGRTLRVQAGRWEQKRVKKEQSHSGWKGEKEAPHPGLGKEALDRAPADQESGVLQWGKGIPEPRAWKFSILLLC